MNENNQKAKNADGGVANGDVIHIEGVDFSYDGLSVLRNLSFSVQRGEVFALLGPNGAGKTTTIRVLNGLLYPSSGSLNVLGFDPQREGAMIRQQTGVLTETPALYERLTAWQNLNFFGALSALSSDKIARRGAAYLEMFELSGRAHDRVETYSKGMKQRLALARALLHDPQLLFLDEPTSGMDPAAARQVEGLIYQVSKRENRSVVLCTHRLYEAEKVCDRVAVMKNGTIAACGSLEELRARFCPGLTVRFVFGCAPGETVLQHLANLGNATPAMARSNLTWEAQVASEDSIPDMIRLLVGAGAEVRAVIPHRATLEEIYLLLQEKETEVKV